MQKGIPKTALVTGSAKRLGRAIAEDLAAHGFAVALHANGSVHEAEAVAAALRAEGKKVIAVKADLGNISETASLIARAEAELGPIGVLVNNASIFEDDTAQKFDAEIFARHFDLHVRAPAILTSAIAPIRVARLIGCGSPTSRPNQSAMRGQMCFHRIWSPLVML